MTELEHFDDLGNLGGVMRDRLGPIPPALMQHLELDEKDIEMMLTFSVAAQPTVQPGRTKDRERAGRSRSPKED